jgi:hypothetical protein
MDKIILSNAVNQNKLGWLNDYTRNRKKAISFNSISTKYN